MSTWNVYPFMWRIHAYNTTFTGVIDTSLQIHVLHCCVSKSMLQCFIFLFQLFYAPFLFIIPFSFSSFSSFSSFFFLLLLLLLLRIDASLPAYSLRLCEQLFSAFCALVVVHAPIWKFYTSLILVMSITLVVNDKPILTFYADQMLVAFIALKVDHTSISKSLRVLYFSCVALKMTDSISVM